MKWECDEGGVVLADGRERTSSAPYYFTEAELPQHRHKTQMKGSKSPWFVLTEEEE